MNKLILPVLALAVSLIALLSNSAKGSSRRTDPLAMTCVEVVDQNEVFQYTRCENREVVCYESQARSGSTCDYKRRLGN